MCGAELGNSTYIFVIDTTIRQRDVADMQAAEGTTEAEEAEEQQEALGAAAAGPQKTTIGE